MLKFQYQAKSKEALNEETNTHIPEMATKGAVVKDDLDELKTERRIVSLVSRLRVLEVKMAILEPQYMINGKRHHVETTRCQAFKERFRRALLLTSGHGFPHLLRSEKLFIKILWLLSMLLSASLCIFFIITNISDYLKYDVFTKTKIQKLNSLNLPAVTICFAIKEGKEHSLEDFLLYCSYQGIDDSCGHEHFQPIKVFDVKKFRVRSCYVFNRGGNKTDVLHSNQVGYSAGINLAIILPKDNFIIYSVHDNKVVPTYREVSGVLQGGFLTNIVVKKLINQKLSEPYNKCHKNLEQLDSFRSKYFDRTLSEISPVYRQINCYDLCMLDYISNKCNCSQTLKTCSDKSAYACALNTYVMMNSDEQCSQFCPIQCDFISYKINKYERSYLVNSASNKKNQRIAAFLAKSNETDLTLEEMQFRFLDLFVFYDEMEQTVISEVPKMTTTGFISDGGGIFGLFLGMSLLSFIELIELLIETLLIFIFKKYKHSV